MGFSLMSRDFLSFEIFLLLQDLGGNPMHRSTAAMQPVPAILSKKRIKEQVAGKKRPIDISAFEERRWPYILTMPVSWLLTLWVIAKKSVYRLFSFQPKINTLWFDGLGLSCRKIRDGAASWRALDEIYNYQFDQRNGLGGFVDDFWVGMMNAQAVRNRLKIVKQEIRRAVLQFSAQREVRIISLACGSAQAVIETVAEFKAEGIAAKAILVDIDQSALDYAVNLASQNGVLSQITIVRGSAYQIARISRNFKPHIVEMVGLLDYFEIDEAIRLIAKIEQILEPNGVFLTCNIGPNPERYFLKWVINWKMIYRTTAQLAEIIREAGFKKIRLIAEPLEIHNLVICQKVHSA